jgi:hypothetical protein
MSSSRTLKQPTPAKGFNDSSFVTRGINNRFRGQRNRINRKSTADHRLVHDDAADPARVDAEVFEGCQVQYDSAGANGSEAQGRSEFDRVHHAQALTAAIMPDASSLEKGERFVLNHYFVHSHPAAPNSTPRRKPFLQNRGSEALTGQIKSCRQTCRTRTHDDNVACRLAEELLVVSTEDGPRYLCFVKTVHDALRKPNCVIQSFLRVQNCRVEEGQAAVLRLQEQRYFVATKNDSLRPGPPQFVNHIEEHAPRFRQDLALAQFAIDDFVDPLLPAARAATRVPPPLARASPWQRIR